MRLKNLLLAGIAAISFCSADFGALADSSATASGSAPSYDHDIKYHHVLLISIDGLHAIDLQTYIANHPTSTLAELSKRGITYTNALTTGPSDSFPGMVAQVTGGSPKSADVFYDVSYDRDLFAPGSNCSGQPGSVTTFDESLDKNQLVYTGGGTLGKPLTQLDPTKLPKVLVDGQCRTLYPHQFLKVNTIFEVLRAHGLHTAWADKHPAYEILNGPSGKGIEDLFTPEVDSNDSITGADTTTGYHSVQRNDLLKVRAVLNEINGKDSTGAVAAPTPAIFGMNFQAISVGEKLAMGNPKDPLDAGLTGGYVDAAGTKPAPGLETAFAFVAKAVELMVDGLKQTNQYKDTLIIISAKHGQSPIDRTLREAASDSLYGNTPGIDGLSDDDEALVWLKPNLQKKDYAAAKAYLLSNSSQLGIVQLLDREALRILYRDPFTDDRTPDFVAITRHGLIYTSGTKLAEHGGFSADDRHVGLLVSGAGIHARAVTQPVETKQIAPTILQALGVDPSALRAVQIEGTESLPELDLD